MRLDAGKFRQAAGAVIRMLAGRWIAGGSDGQPVGIDGGLFRITPLGPLILGSWPLSQASFDGVRFDATSGNGPIGATTDFWDFWADNTAVFHGDATDAEGRIEFSEAFQGATAFELTFEFYPGCASLTPPSHLYIGPWALVGGGEMPRTTLISTWPAGALAWYQIQIEYSYPDIWCWADSTLRHHATVSAPLDLSGKGFAVVWQSLNYAETGKVRNLQLKSGIDGV